MANENCLAGMGCPECGSEGPFRISVQVMALVADDGTDLLGGDTDWDDDSTCVCVQCDHLAAVADFRVKLAPDSTPANQPALH